MRRLLFLIVLLCCSWPTVVWAQRAKQDPTEVLKQLLAMPAPFPGMNKMDEGENEKRPNEFFKKENVPPDDAPIDDLLAYWIRWAEPANRPEPSSVVKQRIFDATAGDAEQLSRYLNLLAESEPIAAKVKEVYDKIADDEQNQYQAAKIRDWLLHNTKYFLGELLAGANNVEDGKNDRIAQERALIALAKFDWQTAKPLLQSLAATGQQRSATLALTLLYKQAISDKNLSDEEKYREHLQSVASDRNQPGRARNDAIEVLSKTEWPARDDWYLSLFNDESLVRLSDGVQGTTPLDRLFDTNPDKWIPILAKMVGSNNPAVQQTAGGCLVRYAIIKPRRDAILPVLRWLTDPEWLSLSSPERAWFMQKMNQLELPESVPGLIWIVENEDSNAGWAARTLAHYKDPRSIPVLRKALTKNREQHHREKLIEGLFTAGGISETEAADAVEAYAEKLLTPEGEEEVTGYSDEGQLPVPLSIGRYLANKENPPAAVVKAVLARVASLRKRNAPLAQSLLQVAHEWKSPTVALDIIHRIAAGTADATAIASVLNRRTELRESLKTELQVLLQKDGIAPGVAAVFLDDKILARTILSSGEQTSQTALLAAARLTETPLAVDLIGALLKSRNSLLVQAAERYLLAEDSKEARILLWQRHPDEAFVICWREKLSYFSDGNLEALVRVEENLRAELLKENGPMEILALFVGPDNSRVLRIYRDRATCTHHSDASRYLERAVSKAQVASFKDVVTTNDVWEMGPQFGRCHHGCQASEFLMLTKKEGRRVIHLGEGDWSLISEALAKLGQDGAKVRYKLEDRIKGVQILYAEKNPKALDVVLQGDEIRVFVEREETEEEAGALTEALKPIAEGDEAARAAEQRRELELLKARFSWRNFAGNKLGEVTTQPDSYPGINAGKVVLDVEITALLLHDARQVRRLSPDSFVIARNLEGLWKQVAGSEIARIGREDGAYANPVVTGDGKWLVVARADTDWREPSYVVRFNVETGREIRVNLDPADECTPIAFVQPLNKVLVRRAKNEDAPRHKSVGPDRPEYYLLDPNTGETNSVTGEFVPLLHEEKRSLQTTGKADEFWAAIPDETKGETQVGRYNARTFSFSSVLTLPHILFTSMDMWIEEKRDRILVVYDGQLISIPLKPQP